MLQRPSLFPPYSERLLTSGLVLILCKLLDFHHVLNHRLVGPL